jgi:two-component system, chemotaxis family, CheB/CheR fusion protein
MPPEKRSAAKDEKRSGRDIDFSKRFPVVGIGASAGGIEAATSLLKDLAPNLGIAYVLVFHLDPARESAVTQILGRATHMPVLEVKNGMQVQPDHVYVIPPNCEMTIDDGELQLRNREDRRSANTSIDTFLRSLALAHGSD